MDDRGRGSSRLSGEAAGPAAGPVVPAVPGKPKVPGVAPEVAAVVESYPAAMRPTFGALRQLIFETAAATEGVGPLTETLKWAEPAYLTQASKSGSTIRLAWKPSAPDCLGLYFNCRTTLIDSFRTLFSDSFSFEGNRAIVFSQDDDIAFEPLALCIAMACAGRR